MPKTRGAHLVMTAPRALREEGYDEGFAIIALEHALLAEERLEPAHGPQRSESQNRGGHCESATHTRS